jgi:hypothetical protein
MDDRSGATVMVIAIVLPLVLLLGAVSAQLGGAGRLGRRWWFGIRTPATMSSDAAWRAGHRAATIPAWIGFAATAATAILAVVFLSSTAGQLPGKLLAIAVFAVTIVWIFVAASTAARAVQRASR